MSKLTYVGSVMLLAVLSLQ